MDTKTTINVVGMFTSALQEISASTLKFSALVIIEFLFYHLGELQSCYLTVNTLLQYSDSRDAVEIC